MELKIHTQEEADQAVKEMLENRRQLFSDGIMGQICPKDCKVSLEERSGDFVFQMTEWMSNPLGIVHGGILVTMFDTCGGILSRIITGIFHVTTVSIQTTFLKPVQIGDEIHLKVKMTSIGKTLLSMTAEIFLPDGKTVAATATMTYYVLKKALDQRQL